MRDCKVDILGTEYSISFKDLGNEEIDGYTDFSNRTIVMRKDNINSLGDFEWLQKKQLRHELIHAFMAESGLQSNWQHSTEFGQDETTVDWFAIQFPKIYKVFTELDLI